MLMCGPRMSLRHRLLHGSGPHRGYGSDGDDEDGAEDDSSVDDDGGSEAGELEKEGSR